MACIQSTRRRQKEAVDNHLFPFAPLREMFCSYRVRFFFRPGTMRASLGAQAPKRNVRL